MIEGGIGGANTGTGLKFEDKVDFIALLKNIKGYSVKENLKTGFDIFYQEQLIARCFKEHSFYYFLEEQGIDWKLIVSKRLLPDDALLIGKTLFIIEVKYQQGAGSVDEKLQTCDFKRKQYSKLVFALGLKVEYVYILNDWFEKPEYKDVLDYIHSVNCYYSFNELPSLAWFGLPNE
ncbi:MAG: hypothetical protein RL344_766 [Pseudomonadota bacterium]|jgi:hypothetical protein